MVIKDESSVGFKSVDSRYLVLYLVPMPDDVHLEAMLKQWTIKGQTRFNEQHLSGSVINDMLPIHALVAVSLWNPKTGALCRHVWRCTEATTTCQHLHRQPEGKSFE